MKHLGSNLRALRNAAGLTQPQLAERAGIEQGYLSKLENGRAAPSQEVIERLATALAVTPAQLTAPTDHAQRSARAYVFGALFGIAAVAVGLLMASPDEPARPALSPDSPLTVIAAIDAAPRGVDIRTIIGGEPGRMMTIRGVADDDRAVRSYLEVLERLGEPHGVDIEPIPWWRLGGVNFSVYVMIPAPTP